MLGLSRARMSPPRRRLGGTSSSERICGTRDISGSSESDGTAPTAQRRGRWRAGWYARARRRGAAGRGGRRAPRRRRAARRAGGPLRSLRISTSVQRMPAARPVRRPSGRPPWRQNARPCARPDGAGCSSSAARVRSGTPARTGGLSASRASRGNVDQVDADAHVDFGGCRYRVVPVRGQLSARDHGVEEAASRAVIRDSRVSRRGVSALERMAAPSISRLLPRTDSASIWRELGAFSGASAPVWAPASSGGRSGEPVLLIPGFLAGDSSLRPLARALRAERSRTHRAGIRVQRRMLGGRRRARRQQRSNGSRTPRRRIALVGHSRGGLFARGSSRGGTPNWCRR